MKAVLTRRVFWFGVLLFSAAGLLFDWPQVIRSFREHGKQGYSTTVSKKEAAKAGGQASLQPGMAINTNSGSAHLTLDDDQKKYLAAAYETAVKEIQARLEQENVLFGLKFALVGSILALLYRDGNQSDGLINTVRSACFVWAAVVTSGIIDTRIHFHQDLIAVLGTWVKEQVEPAMLGSSITGWETYLRQNGRLMQEPIYPLLRLNTNLLTFVLFAAVAYVSLQFSRIPKEGSGTSTEDEGRPVIRTYCKAGSLTALFVFLLVGIHFNPAMPRWLATDIMLALLGWWSCCRIWGSSPPMRQSNTGNVSAELLLLGLTTLLTTGCTSNTQQVQTTPPPHPLQIHPEASVQDRATAYLSGVMDQFHRQFWIYSDGDSAGNHFVALARMSNWDDKHNSAEAEKRLPPMNMFCSNQPHSGLECIEANFRPLTERDWGAWYFMNGVLIGTNASPAPNWGDSPGSGWNLSGAVRLSFWARGRIGGEQVEFFAFGVGRNPKTGMPSHPYPDSSLKRSLGCISLTREWKQYEISLQRAKLDYVLGGFGWAAAARDNSIRSITFYLDDIAIDLSRLQEPRFLASYEAQPSGEFVDRVLRNTAYAYDNALALMAFLAVGDKARAKVIADAFVYAQQHDRYFNDNSLRNAYQAGDFTSPPGWSGNAKSRSARLPGFTYGEGTSQGQWLEDEYCVSRDTGNMAWVMLGLLAYHEATTAPSQNSQYLASAELLGEWVATNCTNSAGLSGYTGGYIGREGMEMRRTYKSTEHNIDLYAAFQRLYLLTHHDKWKQRAEFARKFVLSMWDPKEGKFWTGTCPDSITINKTVVPVDIQAWALLALKDGARPYTGALNYAEKEIRRNGGYDFSKKLSDPPPSLTGTDYGGIWYEGTAHMAAAYKLMDRLFGASNPAWHRRADELRRFLESRQDIKGGMRACDKTLWTGFYMPDGHTPWMYYSRVHVGATAWLVLVESGYNPYWP